MPRQSAKTQPIEPEAPDFEAAVQLYKSEIRPAVEDAGEASQAASSGYKRLEKDFHVNRRAAKFVFKVAGESDEKRNDILRSVRGLLDAMGIAITADLVSDAERDLPGEVIPIR